jgi:hypothetical protein
LFDNLLYIREGHLPRNWVSRRKRNWAGSNWFPGALFRRQRSAARPGDMRAGLAARMSELDGGDRALTGNKRGDAREGLRLLVVPEP